jgi:hypothetical protein
MTFSIRWLFAIAVVVCGIVVLVKSAGSNVVVATGLGLVLAGVGLVAP